MFAVHNAHGRKPAAITRAGPTTTSTCEDVGSPLHVATNISDLSAVGKDENSIPSPKEHCVGVCTNTQADPLSRSHVIRALRLLGAERLAHEPPNVRFFRRH